MRTLASRSRKLPESPTKRSPDPRGRKFPYLLKRATEYLRAPTQADNVPFYCGAHQSREPIAGEIDTGKPFRLSRSQMLRKTRQECIPCERTRFIITKQGPIEPTLVITLEAHPDVSVTGPGNGKPIEHGAIAHAENPLDLEHAVNNREAVGFIPLFAKRGIRHQEFGGKSVCLFFML